MGELTNFLNLLGGTVVHRFFRLVNPVLTAVLLVASPASASVQSNVSSPQTHIQSSPQSVPDWTFTFAIDSAGKPIKPGTAAPKVFSYGICKGTFQRLVNRSGFLDWGAQSSCTASNNYFYLHSIRVELYDSCLIGLCIFFDKIRSIVSPAGSNYSRVATANGHDYCVGNRPENSRTYEQRATVTIRDVVYGPFAQQAGIHNCDIQP